MMHNHIDHEGEPPTSLSTNSKQLPLLSKGSDKICMTDVRSDNRSPLGSVNSGRIADRRSDS